MENIRIAIALGVIPAFVGFNACLKFWRETSERQMFFEAQKHLLDKLGSAAEVTQFLASGEGKDFIDRLKPPPPEPPKPPSPADVLFLLIWVGMIMIGIGAGFLISTLDLFVRPGLCFDVHRPPGIVRGVSADVLAIARCSLPHLTRR